MVEKRLHQLDELVMSLDRYPPGAVVVALGTYLEGLLGALFDGRQCTADEVREPLSEIEADRLCTSHRALCRGDAGLEIAERRLDHKGLGRARLAQGLNYRLIPAAHRLNGRPNAHQRARTTAWTGPWVAENVLAPFGRGTAPVLDHVLATRFLKRMTTGRNCPVLLSCDVDGGGGDSVEVVAKFSSAECGVAGLAREALTAMLAADLGLPVPEPMLVGLVDGFVDALPPDADEVRNLMLGSVIPTFGCAKLPPGFFVWTSDRRIDDRMLEQGAEIFAFDVLTLNADRRPDNPNCQSNGSTFAIFDHDLALLAGQVGTIFAPAPWTMGGASTATSGPGEHLLYRGLRGRGMTLDRLEQAWNGIPADRIYEYRDALPDTWGESAQLVDDAVHYLIELQGHLSAAFTELRRVLA